MEITFGKDKTTILKGIAIILMIALHSSSNPNLQEVSPIIPTFKICVGIFTFLVGFGYYFSKTKDFKYSYNHIKKLLIPFWTIFFLFIVPVVFTQLTNAGWNIFFLNLIGVNSTFHWYSWFVAFFIYAMIVMPFLSHFIEKKPIFGTAFFVLISFTLEVLLHELYPLYTENNWTQRIFDCLLMTPCMLFGYLAAQKHIYTSIKVPTSFFIRFLVASVLITIIFSLRYWKGDIFGFNMDAFYAPIFILSVLMLFQGKEKSFLSRILSQLGKTSVYMWFLHVIFYMDKTSNFYSPLLLFKNSYILSTIWIIILTFFVSWCLMKLTDKAKKIFF